MSISDSNFAEFNGANFASAVTGLTVLTTNPYAPPKRSLNVYDIARSHKSKVATGFYTEKNILVRVGISRATRDLLENSIDSLMNLLHDIEGLLIIKQAGLLRKYTATFAESTVAKDGGAYIEIDLIFKCSDRFGYDTYYSIPLSYSGETASSRDDAITFDGSAPTQVPIIRVTYSAVSGGTGTSVTITNDITTQAVTVTRNWAAGDVLEIDCATKTVKANSVEVAFTGAIPEWATGAGSITYSDTIATSRTFALLVKYERRWS